MSRSTPSVLSSWARTIVDALEGMGFDADLALSAAGLSRSDLRDPNARMPAPVSARLWAEAARVAGDPAFGLRASQFVGPTTFHALGYALFASATLREALDRLVRYGHVVSDAAELVLETKGGLARLRWEITGSSAPPSHEAVDAVMSLILRTARTLTDRSFSLALVEQRRPTPSDVAPYERFFRCPIAFASPEDALSLQMDALDRPLSTANPSLAEHNDELVRRYLAAIREGTVVDRARAALFAEPSASADEIAATIGLSRRTLQRKLGEHDASFASLVHEVRADLGRALLRDGRLSVTEIAFRLGFDDSSAFSRAFKKWTGLSPTEFRASPSR